MFWTVFRWMFKCIMLTLKPPLAKSMMSLPFLERKGYLGINQVYITNLRYKICFNLNVSIYRNYVFIVQKYLFWIILFLLHWPHLYLYIMRSLSAQRLCKSRSGLCFSEQRAHLWHVCSIHAKRRQLLVEKSSLKALQPAACSLPSPPKAVF